MPIALIVFGDKTHTDLHGALYVAPIIFTLTLFNRAARNNPSFWRPLAYIPNSSHGKGKSDKTKSSIKCQDEHTCLALAFKDPINVYRSNRGIKMKVQNKYVNCCIWIHFFIEDTAGFNTWLGHYNGSGKLKIPWRDCHCSFKKMSDPYAICKHVTLDETRKEKRRKHNARTEKEKKVIFHKLSKHDIRNALTEPDLPLSDLVHGPYGMMPPELLHAPGNGLIMY